MGIASWFVSYALPWIGIALIMAGLWQLGYKKRSAFIWTFVGEFLWIVSAVHRGIWDLAFVSLFFLVLAVRNWLCWAPVKEPVEMGDN